MKNDSFKRILVFGQAFNNYSGGGITLSNLFKRWPNDKIAVTATGHALKKASSEICKIYYQLGREDQKWIFPFNFLQKSFNSGLISFSAEKTSDDPNEIRKIRKVLVDRIFFPFINWIGLIHCLSKIALSQNFKNWLAVYKPQVLYLQVSSREEILFSTQLIDYLRIPTVIHMMDDWPSTIAENGLFKDYWRKKIDGEFRQLLSRIDLFLSISEAMSSEYLSRYSRKFTPFHNPIEISNFKKINYRNEGFDKKFRILYLGRIGVANKNSIYFFAKIISGLRLDKYQVQLDIFTNDVSTRESAAIEMLDNVNVSPPVSHSEVPELIRKYDLLFLPLDFTEKALKFARYSIPTKASEYLASGIPVLLFAPAEMAISRFCYENECGFCITEQNKEKIEYAIQTLIHNANLRQKLSENGIRLAHQLFNINIVREKFQQLLITTLKS